jgi:hypothetical protein
MWWLGLAGLACASPAAESVAKEYQIKAVFLFNVVQFVQWPESVFAGPDAPIAIGVLGENPFGTALDDTVRGETVRNRSIVVRYARRLDQLQTCQVIFIARSERGHVAEILSALGNAPVLTASDVPGFAEQGGLVEFYLDANRVRFAVNLAVARAHGLKPSSQMLNLARIVASDPERR